MRSPKTGAWTLVRLFPKALVFIAVLITGTVTTQALPGLSPIWEKLYNNNQPFDPQNPAHQPTADFDNDGWDNISESAAGTHPFNANPAENGIIRPTITAHPDSQNTFILSWPTHIGKRYRLFVSPNLAAASWTLCADPMTGTGEEIALLISAINEDNTIPEKQFWRILIDDIPSAIPGNGHNQWEQEIINSHPDINPDINPPTPTPEPDDDQDGIPNSNDAAKADSKIAWLAAAEPRYAWLPIDSGGLIAVDVNDKGQVLFSCLPPEDFATQPVGKIWDPSQPADKRWTEIFFQPSNFSIRMQKLTKEGQASIAAVAIDLALENITSPDSYGPIRTTSTYVQLHALGDDGSVMAQVLHTHKENYDIEQPRQASPDSAYVFIWGPGSSKNCKLLGTSRGYGVDQKSWTYNIPLGFYTDYKANPPAVRAFIFDQEHTPDSADDYRTLYFKSYKTTGDPDEKTTLASSGHQQTSDTLYNIQSLTPKGSVIFVKLGPGRTPADLTFMVANPQGGTATFPYREDFDSLTEIPGDPTQPGPWALGSGRSPFLLYQGQEIIPTETSGILQLDAAGIGIGSGAIGSQPPAIASRGSDAPATLASGGSSKRDIWINGEFIDFAQATGEPDFPSQLVPKKITASGIIWAGDANRATNGILIQARIVPDDNMAGVVGDTIKSILPNSKVDHFVSPRRTNDINQDYVEVKAAGMDAETFNRLYTWEGGESGTSAEKRKVNRDNSGLTELKLKTKDGAIAAQMNVWIVWTTPVVYGGTAKYELIKINTALPDDPKIMITTGAQYYIPKDLHQGKRFVFKIDPASIVDPSNPERPALDGPKQTKLAGEEITHLLYLNEKADSARFKWDVSRKVRINISNPGMMPQNKLPPGLAPITKNQPLRNFTIFFPIGEIDANDDPYTSDESGNPYEIETDKDTIHQIGEISSYDAPSISMHNARMTHNDTLKITYDFQEFCRLELWDGKRKGPKFWFRISTPISWHHKMSGIYNSTLGEWEDRGSTSGNTQSSPFTK